MKSKKQEPGMAQKTTKAILREDDGKRTPPGPTSWSGSTAAQPHKPESIPPRQPKP